MSCCGRTKPAPRETDTAGAAERRPLHAPASVPGGQTSNGVWLRYAGSSPVLVRGPVTRREYEFSNLRPVQRVDVRDAADLLRTRLFRQTW